MKRHDWFIWATTDNKEMPSYFFRKNHSRDEMIESIQSKIGGSFTHITDHPEIQEWAVEFPDDPGKGLLIVEAYIHKKGIQK